MLRTKRPAQAARRGEVTACVNEQPARPSIWARVYDDLRRLGVAIASRERESDLTGIVHEAWLRLRLHPPPGGWQSRAHYYGAACHAMRQALVDRARKRFAIKRGAGRPARALLDHDVAVNREEVRLLMIEDALQELAKSEPRQAQVAEMKLFGDLPMEWIAERLNVSARTAQRDWVEASERLREWLSGA